MPIQDIAWKTSWEQWMIEMVREIHAGSVTWWWWYIHTQMNQKIYMHTHTQTHTHTHTHIYIYIYGDGLLHIDPSSSLTIAALHSHLSWGCSTEGHKPSVCKLILTLASCPPTDSSCSWNSNCLNPSVASGYIIVSYPPASCGCTHLPPSPNSTTSTGQGDIPISSTGCTCFAALLLIYTGASLDWRLGWGSICYTHTYIYNHANIYIYIYIQNRPGMLNQQLPILQVSPFNETDISKENGRS